MKKILVGVIGIALIVVLAIALGKGNQNPDQYKPEPTPSGWVMPPSMINPEIDKYTEVNVGSSVVLMVDDAEHWTVEISDQNLLKFIPGGDQGSYETYPGLTALATGSTSVVAINKAGERFEFKVLIREKGDQLWGPDALAEELARAVMNQTEEDAISLISRKGPELTYRIVKRDGESYIITMDYSTSRINMEIENGIVTNAYVG